MDAEFLSMMPHTVGITPDTETDAWGNRTYGTLVSYRCRIENKRRKMISKTGQEVISETALYLDTVAAIGIDSKVTMPTGYLPLNPEIIAVKILDDENGAYASVLYV